MTQDLFLQLGVAGGTLAILFTFTTMLFKFMTGINEANNGKIEKLCDKIDILVDKVGEDDKEKEAIIRSLPIIHEAIIRLEGTVTNSLQKNQ